MKVPLSWLKEYIKISYSPASIAKMLTLAGLEVDSVETLSPRFTGVIVGKVIQVQKHPNAEKLCIATVTDGKDSFQVVCGAPNCKEGMKTAFAQVGAVLQGEDGKEFKVKQAKLRGADSFGMLCSAKELNVGDEYEGIIEFSEHLVEGADVAEIYSDTIFEISLTPNLGHCASLIGLARELSALTGERVQYPQFALKEESHLSINSLTSVKVHDKIKCPRYACRLIQDVKIAPSPYWMQQRLTACGIRPINNVVDITNYVLLEMGHPLHAFDFDLLDGQEINVRCAEEGESFTTLDSKERKLSREDLLICDRSKGVALAGIMGGENSEVSDKTRNVLIESAYFQPSAIRKTSKNLGLQTDASKRFERGTDPNQVHQALDRVAMFLHEIAGGKIVSGIIDVKEHRFPEKIVNCRLKRINKILGTHLSLSEVETIFHRLGMHYTCDGQDTFTVTIPTFRVDIQAEIDLVEEVARIYGYENIPIQASRFHSSILPNASIFIFEREMRSQLIKEGLQEFITCDLIGPSLMQTVQDQGMPLEAIIKVINPTSIEQSILRTSLLPGLLQSVKFNFDHQTHNISGFEVGRIHFKEGEKYKEQSVAGIILTGKRSPQSWDNKTPDYDFYDMKGIVENVLNELGIDDFSFKENNLNIFHTGRQASVYVGSLEVGSLGEVHPAITRRLDVSQRILFAELNLHDLIKVRKPLGKMKEISLYPSSERDWTITLPENIPIYKVFSAMQNLPSTLLEDVSLLDIYRSEKLGPGLKNATFHFVYRDLQKTVSQDVVDAEHARLTSEALKTINQVEF